MRLFDTHTHLYLPDFEESGGSRAAVERAVQAGVERMLMPNVDLTTIDPLRRLQAEFPERISVAMGLHPTEISETWRDDVALALEALCPGDVAIGEVGMDLYWTREYRNEQMQALELQAQKAVELGLPLVIHCREALDETLEVLEGVKGVRGVMHSFGGSVQDVDRVRRALGDDWYFGINGIVTFRKSTLPTALPAITPERMLLETDSPYLAPVPMRGRVNESAYITHIATFAAYVLGLSPDRLADITFANALALFRL